ncbi:hypothetical protein [Streptomyces sp. NPDC096311]|uniref:hypothetical protein n=1 Tax=Streptomyces sp. NPDC096311 TaxID=3366083 RepID=UPI00382E43BE
MPLTSFVAAALLVAGVPGVVVGGVGEGVGEGFPLAVSAPPPHRIAGAAGLEAVEGPGLRAG